MAGLTYVYAVRSRRAGGVSIGVNLSPNNACNWRCAYCQVAGLVRGRSPSIDLDRLEAELEEVLARASRGELVEGGGPIRDIAFSGNGEPTTSPDFAQAVERVGRVVGRMSPAIPLILITNGSRLDQAPVRAGVRRLGELGGRVWFKVDRVTAAGILEVNGARVLPAAHLARLRVAASLCPTWVQSCFFARRGEAPPPPEVDAWVAALGALAREGVPVRGVLLYTLARTSAQPGGDELGALDGAWLGALAERVRGVGIADVQVSLAR
ncbi:MAG: radical SAM protein [Myxococcaceae bacterium]|nr:radical SAM protein [Myxococcaceae bacterium]